MFYIFEMILALLAPDMLEVLLKVEEVFDVILGLFGIRVPEDKA